MTGTSEELKQAWIKAWVAYGFGDYDVASKRFQFWLQRFNAERQRLGRHWSSRTQANCEQLLAEIARHIKPGRKTTPMGEQQRINSAFWAGRHLMVMLSRQDRTMEGAVPVVKPTPSGERLISEDAPVKTAPAPRAAARPAAPPTPAAPVRAAAPQPAAPVRQARPVEPPPPVAEPVVVPVVVEPPATPAPPPPVEVAVAPALSAPPALESEPTVEDIAGLEDLTLDDLDLSELDGDLDLGELDLDDASLEDLDMEGLEDLDMEGLEGLDDLELDGDLEDIDLGEV